MVKLLQRLTLVLFILVLAAFIAFSIVERLTTDTTMPYITVDSDVIEISVKDKKEALLSGVTAYDGKDGDISDRILIESISKFIEPGVCSVTYAVADSDKHVAKQTRTVRYTDYTPPEFYMKRALVYGVDEALDIRAAVGARDSIDGDISDRVSIVTTDYVKNTIGVFTVSLQVSNSMGDTIYLDVTVHVEGNETMAPQIQLKKSLIYVKKGEEPIFEDYLGDVTVNGVLMKKDEIQLLISTNFDSEETGTYNVHYYITTNEGYEGHSILTVVVEE
ncbi:MAG: hypothetical protein IJE14_02545 [Clostridia bacterium]|nr:hypothetical protein [Clostridia bacterium]MBR3753991.1 hypothetical protein [Clostridia bacterium]